METHFLILSISVNGEQIHFELECSKLLSFTEHGQVIKFSDVHEMWLMSIITLELLFIKLRHREVKWWAPSHRAIEWLGSDEVPSFFTLNSECCALSLHVRIKIFLLLPPFPASSLFLVMFFFLFLTLIHINNYLWNFFSVSTVDH